MRRLLIALLLANVGSYAVAAGPAFVQAPTGCTTFSSGKTVTCSYSAAVTTGDMLIGVVAPNNSSGSAYTVTVSDNVNGNWTKAAECFSAFNGQADIFYYKASSSGSITVTVTIGTSTSLINLSIAEYSGVSSISPFDGTPTCGSQSSGSTYTGPSVTTTTPNEMLVAGLGIGGHPTGFSVSSPYALRIGSYNAFADEAVATTGAYSGATFSSAGDSGFVIGAALKPTSTIGVASPTATPGAGTYTSAQSVSLATTTSGAKICYTTDGSTPTATTPGTCSHGTTYSSAVAVSSSLTLKAIGTLSGNTNSGVLSAAYVISVPVATPTTAPGAGTYTSAQSASLTTTTSGATICFTTDGSTPTATTPGTCSHGTTYSTLIAVSSSLTLKAIGTLSGYTNSGVLSAAYVISVPVATPTATPGAGTYTGAQSVLLATATSGATICFTTDGSAPTTTTPGTCSHGTTYSSAVAVSSSLTLKAIGTLSGYTASGVLSATYVITGSGGTATPVIGPFLISNMLGSNANYAPSPVLMFGKQGTGTSSMAIPLAINNCSNSAIPSCSGSGNLTLAATPFTISGTNASDFSVANGTCSANGVIATGSYCSPTITFTPTASAGTNETATLTAFDNGTTSTQTLSLTGTSATVTLLTSCSPSTSLSSNTNYQLTQNVSAIGSCFIDSATNVDLNLNGFTITYCSSSANSLVGGILVNGFNESTGTFHNGTIQEAAGQTCTGLTTDSYPQGSSAFMTSSSGSSSSSYGNSFFNLYLSTNDAPGRAIFEEYAGAVTSLFTTLHDVSYTMNGTYNCPYNNVGCRAGDQFYAIIVDGTQSSGAPTFYNIGGTGGTQGGIGPVSPHGTVEYTLISPGSAVATNSNGFSLQAWSPNSTLQNNLTIGPGNGGSCTSCRGIQVSSAAGAATGILIKNNVEKVTQLANNDEYGGCQLGGGYGGQINTAGSGLDLSNNTFLGNTFVSTVSVCPGVGFSISGATADTGPNNTINNTFGCNIASSGYVSGTVCAGIRLDALQYSPAPDNAVISTGDFIYGDTSAIYVLGTPTWTCKQCTFGKGSNPVIGWTMLDYDGGINTGCASNPLYLIDPTFTNGAVKSSNNLNIWAGNNSSCTFSYTVQWTYTITVEQASNSAPISGAAVAVTDTNGTTECSGVTNGSGLYSCILNDTKYQAISGTYSTPSYNPMAIHVSAQGCTTGNYSETITSTSTEIRKLSGC